MTSASPTAAEPTALRGWLTVAMLVAAYALSFVDRQILSLLVEPLKTDLHITDTQIGLLQGPAFGLFYSVLGLPLGWLADRVNRVRLIAIGIFLWSVMTISCGLATDFGGLFLGRVGVGVGEATLVPAAISLLADLFKPQRRALPMSVFTAGLSLGAGLALVLGGSFILYAKSGAATLPLVGAWLGQHHPWQVVFLMAGAAGVPVTLAVLALSEPSRQTADSLSHNTDAPAGGGAYLKAHWKLFAPLLAGTSLLYLYTNALAGWMPSLFIRSFGWTPMQVGLRLGFWIMAAAVTGNIASGFVATAIARRGQVDAPLRTMLIGSGLMVPVSLLAALAPTPSLAMVGVIFIYLSTALCFGIATTTVVAVTPGRLRGLMVALYLLLGNLVGMSLGPLSVGVLLDRVLHDPRKVGWAIAAVAAATIPAGFLLMRSIRPRYAVRAAALATAA
jgi:MFS family permease